MAAESSSMPPARSETKNGEGVIRRRSLPIGTMGMVHSRARSRLPRVVEFKTVWYRPFMTGGDLWLYAVVYHRLPTGRTHEPSNRKTTVVRTRRRQIIQDHERSRGFWQSRWEVLRGVGSIIRTP